MTDLLYLIGLLLILALLLRLDIIFYVLYVLAGVYGASRILTHRAVSRLEVRRTFTDHAFFNDQVTVTITVRNRSRWSLPWVRVDESVPIELHAPNFVRQAYNLKGRESATLSYTLRCRRRGYYALGPLHLTAGDPFGFSEVERAEKERPHLVVYPPIVSLMTLGLPATLPFGIIRSRERLFEDPNRLAGTREYRTGDSIRHIHWKASAHADQLLVKRLEPAITQEMALILDLDGNVYSRRYRHLASEWAIVVAASIAHHLGTNKQPVALLTNGHDPLSADGTPPMLAPPRPGQGHVMQILELLARIQLNTRGPALESLVLDTVLPLSWGVTVALVTPRTDATTYRTLQSLVRRGFNVLLLVVEPMANFAPVMARAQSVGAHAYHVWREAALRALREEGS